MELYKLEKVYKTYKSKFQENHALNGIDLNINEGEIVIILGPSGSGKSTMLKVIAGVLKPTKGSVKVEGTVAPLIELGAGFDMDLTASENIFLNGAILGYSHDDMEKYFARKQELTKRTEQVVGDKPIQKENVSHPKSRKESVLQALRERQAKIKEQEQTATKEKSRTHKKGEVSL